MNLNYIRQIPGPDEVRQALPVSAEISQVKNERDAEICGALSAADGKFLMVIGPCSAHDEDAVCEFVSRLARVNEKTRDRLVIIPRIYTNKPRTTGEGYKGMMHQPDPRKTPNIVEGISAIRRMHLRAIGESGLTAADEMLYPTNHPYLDDLLSYVTVGARSVENQQHRLTASGLDIPVGMKNPMSGDFKVMLNSISAAQQAHVFTYNGWEVSTGGNPFAHAVLRGAVDHHGRNMPNYHYEDLVFLAEAYAARNLANPAVIIDTNHSNSNKHYDQQPRVALEIMESRRQSPQLRRMVKGLMVESYLLPGMQKADENTYGKSITDPCLGWEETEKLLLTVAERA